MIAYIDLNYPDFHESYSMNPKSYGGGRIFASAAKELIENFFIFSSEESFKDVSDNENKERCIVISDSDKERLRNGDNAVSVIPRLKDFDVIVHHFANRYINTNIPQVVWAVGYGEPIHPQIQHLMLYSRNRQNPTISNRDINIYDVVIGIPIEDKFEESLKDDYIFQCSRHTPTFGSIDVAKFCLDNSIKGIFAGPIDNNYPLLKYVDNKTTFYLGQISEEDKIEYTKKARLCTFLHSWNTPFNLSAITSLSNGTPIVSTNVGFWKDLIVNNYNGFIIDNPEQLIDIWDQSQYISQYNCYESVKDKYDSIAMVTSFQKAIKEVIS